jgi:hypothetical protein
MVFREEEFEVFLDERGVESETKKAYVEAVRKADDYFTAKGLNFHEADVADFEEYVDDLIETGENTEDNIVGLARYVYMCDMKEVWIYFASILGGRGILPSIAERLEEIEGESTAEDIFSHVKAPPLGSKPEKYCQATNSLMRELSEKLSPEVYRRVLAGNHHRVPESRFEKHKKWFLELDGDIDAWLKRVHEEAAAELEEYLREDKVWFEQVITQDIVDYVRDNQEILSGVRNGEWIYYTKFPYAPQDYLDEDDSLMKRYYMCHCPLAREAVLSGEPDIPMDWCYCSAGYGKLRYDIVFGEETETEVLESVFSGSDKCRFRVLIPEKWR